MDSVLFLFIFRQETSEKSLISERTFSRSALSRRNRVTSSAYITSFSTALTIFLSLGMSGKLIPSMVGVYVMLSAISSRPRMKAKGENGQLCRIPDSTLIGSDNQPM